MNRNEVQRRTARIDQISKQVQNMLQSHSFDDLSHQEKIVCLTLLQFKKRGLRVDSRLGSESNLNELHQTHNTVLMEKQKRKRSIPSRSRVADKPSQQHKSACSLCHRTFNRKYELERHMRTVHVEPVKCTYCEKHLKLMNRKDMQKKHLTNKCPQFVNSGHDIDAIDLESIFIRIE